MSMPLGQVAPWELSVAVEYCSSLLGTGVPAEMSNDWIEPSVKVVIIMLPWIAMPLIMPPANPLTDTSLTKVRLHPGSTWNVPMVFDEVKPAYRYWLFMAKAMPFAVPLSLGDPVALPPTVRVLMAIPVTPPVEATEA